jgi:NAD(P)-dependent dehydrogenase (short-subunit alcohol dehydrogenase family)
MAQHRVALVTGAGSGMGRLAARRLAADGIEVAAVDLDADGLAETSDLSPTISPLVCDVTDSVAVDELMAWVAKELGPIDRVVAAAGIAPTAPLVDQPVDTILRVMDVNYGGVVRVVKAALPSMLERGSGEVVVFASLAGWMPTPSLGAYCATKHALVAFSEVLAHELQGSGVKLACVCPPLVDTPMIRQLEDGGVTFHRKITPLAPEVVIDAVERALAAGDLFVFPGRGTKAMVRTRRLAPAALWKILDRQMD